MVELERLQPEHYERAAAWLSDPSNNRWLTSRWHDKTFTPQHIAVIVANPATYLCLVRDSGEPVGLIALYNIDRGERSASLWCVIDEAHRSRLVSSTAVAELMAIGFEELKLASINAWTTIGNVAPQRVLERVGFHRVGVLRRASLLDGKNVDRIVFDLVPEDLIRADAIRREKV